MVIIGLVSKAAYIQFKKKKNQNRKKKTALPKTLEFF